MHNQACVKSDALWGETCAAGKVVTRLILSIKAENYPRDAP